MNDTIVEIPITSIEGADWQPREEFSEESIKELADSIQERGLIQPISVRKHLDKYQIIAGERRFRAHVLLRKDTIAAIVKNVDDIAAGEISLIENWQRRDLNDREKEQFFTKLYNAGFAKGQYKNQADMARKVGIPQSTVSNLILSGNDRETFVKMDDKNVYDNATTNDLKTTRLLRNDAITRHDLIKVKMDKKLKLKDLRDMTEGILTIPNERRKEVVELISKDIIEPENVGQFAKTFNESSIDVQNKLLSKDVSQKVSIDLHDKTVVNSYRKFYEKQICSLKSDDILSIENKQCKEECIEFINKSQKYLKNILLELVRF